MKLLPHTIIARLSAIVCLVVFAHSNAPAEAQGSIFDDVYFHDERFFGLVKDLPANYDAIKIAEVIRNHQQRLEEQLKLELALARQRADQSVGLQLEIMADPGSPNLPNRNTLFLKSTEMLEHIETVCGSQKKAANDLIERLKQQIEEVGAGPRVLLADFICTYKLREFVENLETQGQKDDKTPPTSKSQTVDTKTTPGKDRGFRNYRSPADTRLIEAAQPSILNSEQEDLDNQIFDCSAYSLALGRGGVSSLDPVTASTCLKQAEARVTSIDKARKEMRRDLGMLRQCMTLASNGSIDVNDLSDFVFNDDGSQEFHDWLATAAVECIPQINGADKTVGKEEIEAIESSYAEAVGKSGKNAVTEALLKQIRQYVTKLASNDALLYTNVAGIIKKCAPWSRAAEAVTEQSAVKDGLALCKAATEAKTAFDSIRSRKAPAQKLEDISKKLKKIADSTNEALKSIADAQEGLGLELGYVEAQLDNIGIISQALADGQIPEFDPDKACKAAEEQEEGTQDPVTDSGETVEDCKLRIGRLTNRTRGAAVVAASIPGLLQSAQKVLESVPTLPPLSQEIARQQLNVRASTLKKRVGLVKMEVEVWREYNRGVHALEEAVTAFWASMKDLCGEKLDKSENTEQTVAKVPKRLCQSEGTRSVSPVDYHKYYRRDGSCVNGDDELGSNKPFECTLQRELVFTTAQLAHAHWLVRYVPAATFRKIYHLEALHSTLAAEEAILLVDTEIKAALGRIRQRGEFGLKPEEVGEFIGRVASVVIGTGIALETF